MATTYKLLKQYFLDRDDTTTGGGNYYYGSGGPQTNNSDFNNSFNSIEIDHRFHPDAGTAGFYFNPLSVIQGNKIIAIDNNNVIRRYHLDSGEEDYSFNAITRSGGTVYGILIMPNNKILLFGNFSIVNNEARSCVAMLDENGSLDPLFQGLTFVRSSSPGDHTVLNGLVVSNDKILLTGYFSSVNGVSRTNSVMLYSDGSIDTSFNLSAALPDASTLALQNDGKILILGLNNSTIYRFYADGSLDLTMSPLPFGATLNKILVQPDGKILASGYLVIKRWNQDGSTDMSFGTSGSVPISGRYGYAYNLALQADNKILAAGSFEIVDGTNADGLVRLNVDGSVDTSFVSPSLQGQFGNNAKSINSIHVLSDNRIIVNGNFQGFGGGTGQGMRMLKEKVNNAPYQLVYTVPSATSVIVGRSFVANHNDFPVYYDIAIVPASDDLVSSRHHVVWDKELDENNYDVVKDKLTLSAGDKIYVYSSTDEKISFNIFGTEITA